MPLVFPHKKWKWTVENLWADLMIDEAKKVPWADDVIVLLHGETTPSLLRVAVPARGNWVMLGMPIDSNVNPFTTTDKESATRRAVFENIIDYTIWKYYTDRKTLEIRQ